MAGILTDGEMEVFNIERVYNNIVIYGREETWKDSVGQIQDPANPYHILVLKKNGLVPTILSRSNPHNQVTYFLTPHTRNTVLPKMYEESNKELHYILGKPYFVRPSMPIAQMNLADATLHRDILKEKIVDPKTAEEFKADIDGSEQDIRQIHKLISILTTPGKPSSSSSGPVSVLNPIQVAAMSRTRHPAENVLARLREKRNTRKKTSGIVPPPYTPALPTVVASAPLETAEQRTAFAIQQNRIETAKRIAELKQREQEAIAKRNTLLHQEYDIIKERERLAKEAKLKTIQKNPTGFQRLFRRTVDTNKTQEYVSPPIQHNPLLVQTAMREADEAKRVRLNTESRLQTLIDEERKAIQREHNKSVQNKINAEKRYKTLGLKYPSKVSRTRKRR